jgi:hypothetical protein
MFLIGSQSSSRGILFKFWKIGLYVLRNCSSTQRERNVGMKKPVSPAPCGRCMFCVFVVIVEGNSYLYLTNANSTQERLYLVSTVNSRREVCTGIVMNHFNILRVLDASRSNLNNLSRQHNISPKKCNFLGNSTDLARNCIGAMILGITGI